jgi:hypothetical protein
MAFALVGKRHGKLYHLLSERRMVFAVLVDIGAGLTHELIVRINAVKRCEALE